MIGNHCLITRSKNQSVIALSSGEAELYVAVLGCSMGIGDRQMYEDLGVALKVIVYMDATAGIAMLNRQGLGTVKHVATQYLWCQELVQNKKVELRKVQTTDNYTDLLTKSLAETPMNYLLSRIGFEVPTT